MNEVLCGGYEGSSIVGPLVPEFPKEFTEETDDYDYDEDSDLEDDDETQAEPLLSSEEKAEDSEPKVVRLFQCPSGSHVFTPRGVDPELGC